MSIISPYLRTPFTDITASFINHQMEGKCQKREMRYMECLEAYGLERGRKKCEALWDNLLECQTMHKQLMRIQAMMMERAKQIDQGKLTGDSKYVNIVTDSY